MCHDAKVFTRKTLFDPALAAVTCLQGLFAHFWSVSRAGPLNEHTCCHDNRQGHTSCPDNISRPVRHPHWPAVTLRLPIILRLESLCMTSPIQCLYWRLTLIDAWRLIMTRIDAWSLTPLSPPWSLLLLSAHLAAWARAYALATKSNEILELDTISTKPAVHDGDDEINQGCPPSNRSYQSSTSLMTPGLCNHQLHDEFYRTMKKERDVLQDLSSFLRCLSSSQSISLSALAPISPVKSRRVSRHDYHSKDLHLTITNSINACNVESLRPNSGVSQWCL